MIIERMRWLITLVLLAALPEFAGAQTLRLNKSEPPELGGLSLVASLIAQLDEELSDLPGLPDVSETDRHRSVRAKIDYRVLAHDLLVQARDHPTEGCHAMVMGMTMFFDRQSIDQFLDEFLRRSQSEPDGGDSALIRARAQIELFSERARTRAEDVRTTDLAMLDDAVPHILIPLAAAWKTLNDAELATHWLSTPARNDVIVPTSLDEVRSLIDASSLPEETTRTAGTIAEFLERGLSFSELRAAVNLGIEALHDAMVLGEAVNAASWLTDEERIERIDRIDAALTAYTQPAGRDQALATIDGFDPCRRLVVALSRLHDAEVMSKLDVAQLARACMNLESALAASAAPDRVIDPRLPVAQMIERLVHHRTMTQPELERPLRPTWKTLDDRCTDIEERLLAILDSLAAEPERLGDPDLGSMISEHRQFVEDLERLGRVAEWKARLRAIDADAAPGFDRQIAKMTQWLVNPVRRHDAVRAMQQFEQQLNLFFPLPDEELLTSRDPVIIEATGGLQEMLAASVASTRIEWAHSWARGDGVGAAAQRMMLFVRLMRAVRESTAIVALQQNGESELLDRWAAWELPPTMIARVLSDPPGRVKLACAMAVKMDDTAFRHHLDYIDHDAPVGRLIAQYSIVLRDQLQALPTGAPGVLGQLTHTPGADAWMAHRRDDLARLCQYAMEAEFARSNRRGTDALRLMSFVNDLAIDLLRDLGQVSRPLPNLIGFDGSDPNADG